MPDTMGGQQPAGFWEKTAPGVKYPDLNRRLKGLPDWLRSIEENVGRPLSAATSKAADTMTMGLAAPLIDKLTGTNTYSRLAKGVQDEHEGFAKAGEMAGTLGSMAMGGVGKVPALSAKALPEIAKLAAPVTRKAADFGKAAIMAGVGGGIGGLESGIRTATGQQEGSVIGNTLAGVGLGAAGGGLGSMAADKLSRLLERLPKRTAKAVLSTADMKSRDTMAALRKQAGAGSGAMKQAEEADDLVRELSGITRKYNLDQEGSLEEVAKWQRAKWKEIDKAFEAAAPDTQASKLLEGMMTGDELAELTKKYGAEKTTEVINGMMKKAGQIQGLANTRDLLQRAIDSSFKATDEDAGAILRDIAGTLRNRLDDVVADTAEKAGVDLGMPFKQFKHEYGLLQPAAKGAIREAVAPQAVAMNSPTAEKLGVTKLLSNIGGPAAVSGSLGTAGALQGISEGGSPAEIAAKAGLGALGGAVASKGIGRLATRGLGKLDRVAPEIAKLAPGVSNLSRAAGIGGAKVAAGAIRQDAVEKVAPQTPGEQKAAETGAAAGEAISSGDTKSYRNQVAERLHERWVRAGMEQYYPGRFDEFINYAREKTGGFEPSKTAQIMFADPEERKKFLDALEVHKTLSEAVPLAERRERNLIGQTKTGTADEASAAVAYQRLQELLKGRAPKVQGAAETAYSLLNKIMGDKKLSTAQKQKQVRKILADYGVAFNLMDQAGVA